MIWYPFPEGLRRKPAPHFRLLSRAGEPVTLADYRGQFNLVLFFAHGIDCAGCRVAVENFIAHGAGYRAEASQVLVIAPAGADRAPASSIPEVIVLTDPGGQARRTYAALLPDSSAGHVLLFVLDRYGAPYAALACSEAGDAAIQQQVLEWLAFIEMECPE